MALAKVLGECGTGADITLVLSERGLVDESGESTKWRRLQWVFLQSQKQYRCANRVLDFIQSFMTPVRFLDGAQSSRRGGRNSMRYWLFLAWNTGLMDSFGHAER